MNAEPANATLSNVRIAAQKGNTDAQYRLGEMYAEGLGVRQDDAEALRWYRMAAHQGLALAQHNLAFMETSALDSTHVNESFHKILTGK